MTEAPDLELAGYTLVDEQIVTATQYLGGIKFQNIFSGEMEPFVSSEQTNASLLRAAVDRINDLERQIAEIRTFLVI